MSKTLNRLTLLSLLLVFVVCGVAEASVVAEGAKVEKLSEGFRFTEGPAADAEGNIYFSDIPNNRIHKWTLDGKLSIFRKNSGGANGLYFDEENQLIACEGGGRRLVSIDPEGNVTALLRKFKSKRFNSPNDLWIDPEGGIYFTDPRYGKRDGMEMNGEHVYYLYPDRKKIIRVIDDMVRPNGVIGTPDGEKLYVSDHGGRKTFVYTINEDGTLSNKKLFAPQGSDGMTIDSEGNVYLTSRAVLVYNRKGEKIEEIKVPEGPANVTFGGKDGKTLFITARTSLYSVRMRVKGYDPTGVYTLVSVNGSKLPANVPHGNVKIKVSSGTFTINSDGTCRSKVIFSLPSGSDVTRKVNATYTQEGSKLNMQWEGAGQTVGTVKSNIFRMINEGMVFVYEK